MYSWTQKCIPSIIYGNELSTFQIARKSLSNQASKKISLQMYKKKKKCLQQKDCDHKGFHMSLKHSVLDTKGNMPTTLRSKTSPYSCKLSLTKKETTPQRKSTSQSMEIVGSKLIRNAPLWHFPVVVFIICWHRLLLRSSSSISWWWESWPWPSEKRWKYSFIYWTITLLSW